MLGPDFQWAVGGHKLTGQYLYSRSQTPNDPLATPEWDGRRLSGHAGDVWYTYNTEHYDAFVEYKDISDEFRADLGFLPQVGVREAGPSGPPGSSPGCAPSWWPTAPRTATAPSCSAWPPPGWARTSSGTDRPWCDVRGSLFVEWYGLTNRGGLLFYKRT